MQKFEVPKDPFLKIVGVEPLSAYCKSRTILDRLKLKENCVKALVTGAGGFVGKAVVEHLLSRGYEVRGMVRNDSAAQELATLGAEAVRGDLKDESSLSSAVKDIDCVFHIAALFRQAGLPSSEFHRVNVEGTQSLLDASIAAGVKKFIHCSTVGVHGHIESPPANEEAPYNPGDAYQESKTEGEKVVLRYLREGKISGSVIRPAMIYGPRDTRTLKLFKMIAKRRFFYVGSGTALVHFVDVRDLAESFRLAAEADAANGEVFIIAGKTSLPLNKLVGIVSSLMGVPEPWLHLPVSPMQALGSLCEAICTPFHINPPLYRRRVDFYTKERSFDCTKAERVLGFHPSQSLVEELSDIIESYIEDGSIEPMLVRKPSAILRDLEGKISGWDSKAEAVYGWSRGQVLGSVSHSVFATQFPDDLASINSELRNRGVWEGQLIHRDRDGRELKVESKWKLVKLCKSKEPLVLELNKPSCSDQWKNKIVDQICWFGNSLLGYSTAQAGAF